MTETEPIPCAVDPRHNLDEHERGTCTACTGRTRADLHGINNASRYLHDILYAGLGSNAPADRARSNDGHPLPGGDALVLLGGGGNALNALRRIRVAEKAGRDHNEPPFGIDDLPTDPLSLGWELGRHEDDWRKVRREPHAEHPYIATQAIGYLLARLGWAAARHPDFPEFAESILTLRQRVERATGTDERTVRAEAPCIDCDGHLERTFRPIVGKRPDTGHGRDTWGLEDDWTCTRCHRRYDSAAYGRAVHQMLAERAARVVDSAQLAEALGLNSTAHVRVLVKRRILPRAVGQTEPGKRGGPRLLYNLAAAREAWERHKKQPGAEQATALPEGA